MANPINQSYFFKHDDVYGWGNRSFFTYYSQFGRPLGEIVAEVTVMIIVFFMSFVTNACLAWIILRYKELHTITNYFILNLVLADILFSASIPVMVIARLTETWILGDVPCRLLLYLQFVCGAVLLWSLTVISFERYQRIVSSPMKVRMSKFHVIVLIVIIWIACLVSCTPVALCFTVLDFHYASRNISICTLVFPNVSLRISYIFVSLMLIINCLLPIIWLVFNYVSIFKKLFTIEKRWQQQAVNRRLSMQFSEDIVDSPEKLRHRKHHRTVKILLLDVCFTILMWSPIIIMMGLIHYDSSKENGYFLQSHDFIATLIFALANTVVNPILYGLFNSNIRFCLKHFWKTMCCSRSNNSMIELSNVHALGMNSSKNKQPVSTMKIDDINSSDLSIIQPANSKHGLVSSNKQLCNVCDTIKDTAISSLSKIKRTFCHN